MSGWRKPVKEVARLLTVDTYDVDPEYIIAHVFDVLGLPEVPLSELDGATVAIPDEFREGL